MYVDWVDNCEAGNGWFSGGHMGTRGYVWLNIGRGMSKQRWWRERERGLVQYIAAQERGAMLLCTGCPQLYSGLFLYSDASLVEMMIIITSTNCCQFSTNFFY